MANSPVPGAQGSEKELLGWLDRLDSESKASRESIDAKKWDADLDAFRGRTWKDTSRSPYFEANVIAPTIERKVGLLTEQKPTMKILSRRSGLRETATILERAVDGGWSEYSMEMQLEDISYYMSIFGSGGINLAWDQNADYGRGDIVPTALDPRNLRFDPAVTRSYQIDTAQYVILDTVAPLWQVWQQYPGRGRLVQADPRVSTIRSDGGGGAWANAMSRLSRVYRSGPKLSEGAIPRAYLREYWFRDPALGDSGDYVGQPIYPFGRHIIRGGDDVVLVDEPNPYWDGGWPVEYVDGRPDPDHPFGRSEVESLRRIQEAINRIGHLFVENTILGGNIWIVGDQDALEPDIINKLTNLGAIVLTKRFGRQLDRQPPPAMPPHFLEFIRLGLMFVDYLTGLNDSTMQGRGRVELRSGTQLEGLQAAAQTLVRSQARRLESFLERLGQKWIARIFQYYNDDRLMTYLGPGPEYQQFQFQRQQLVQELTEQALKELHAQAQQSGQIPTAEETSKAVQDRIRMAWRDFRFKVIPGSSLGATKMQRAMMFAQLAENSLISRKKVLEALDIANPDEEIAQAMREAAQMGMPAGAGGKKKAS